MGICIQGTTIIHIIRSKTVKYTHIHLIPFLFFFASTARWLVKYNSGDMECISVVEQIWSPSSEIVGLFKYSQNLPPTWNVLSCFEGNSYQRCQCSPWSMLGSYCIISLFLTYSQDCCSYTSQILKYHVLIVYKFKIFSNSSCIFLWNNYLCLKEKMLYDTCLKYNMEELI